jgi:hypothetical protein
MLAVQGGRRRMSRVLRLYISLWSQGRANKRGGHSWISQIEGEG